MGGREGADGVGGRLGQACVFRHDALLESRHLCHETGSHHPNWPHYTPFALSYHAIRLGLRGASSVRSLIREGHPRFDAGKFGELKEEQS